MYWLANNTLQQLLQGHWFDTYIVAEYFALMAIGNRWLKPECISSPVCFAASMRKGLFCSKIKQKKIKILALYFIETRI